MSSENKPVSELSGFDLDRAVAGLTQSLGSLADEMVAVNAIFEVQRPDWHYRFNVRADGRTVVYRTPSESPLWGHGVIKQVFDRSAGSFVPGVRASLSVAFDSLDEAVGVCLSAPVVKSTGPAL